MTGISALAYSNLNKHLGIDKPTRVFDVVQQLANVDMEVIDLFGVDVPDINRITAETGEWYEADLADGTRVEFPGWYRPDKLPDGSWQTTDEEGRVLSRMPVGATCFDQTFFPYQDGYPEDFDDLEKALQKIRWVLHSHAYNLDAGKLRKRLIRLREETGKAPVMSGGVKLLELVFFARRMDNFLTDLLVDREKMCEMLDRLVEVHLAGLEKKISALGDIVDVIRFGDDLGMNTGPFMDLDTFGILRCRDIALPGYSGCCDIALSGYSGCCDIALSGYSGCCDIALSGYSCCCDIALSGYSGCCDIALSD